MHRIKSSKELELQRGMSYRRSNMIKFPQDMDEVCGKLIEFGAVSNRAVMRGSRPWTVVKWMAAPVNDL